MQGDVQQVTVYVSVGVKAALEGAARAARRSVSAQAALMIEAGLGAVDWTPAVARVPRQAGLGEGEPNSGGVGPSPAAAVDPVLSGDGAGSSPSPSPRVLEEAGADGAARGSDPRGLGVAKPAPSSACPMVVPRGVKCKACGKVHG